MLPWDSRRAAAQGHELLPGGSMGPSYRVAYRGTSRAARGSQHGCYKGALEPARASVSPPGKWGGQQYQPSKTAVRREEPTQGCKS